VYTLLNNDELPAQGGVLERRQLSHLLDNRRYPLERQWLILSLMEKFELVFAFEGGERYLIPDLLPLEQPVFAWNEEGSLLFEYHYAVLPRSILHRFMVRLHPFIHERIAWRTGVMLAYEEVKALVKADIEDKQIQIAVQGKGGRREFLSMLRFTFNSLHEDMITGTKPQEHVPIPGYTGKTVSYKHLLRLEERGDTEYLPDGVDEPIDVQALLGSVEDPAYRRQGAFTRQEVYQLLRDGYGKEDEVGELCFLLEVDESELGGGNTAAKLRELVVYMERRGRIPDLIKHLQNERPNLFRGRKRT
jgi:GTPase SAR1 family protein